MATDTKERMVIETVYIQVQYSTSPVKQGKMSHQKRKSKGKATRVNQKCSREARVKVQKIQTRKEQREDAHERNKVTKTSHKMPSTTGGRAGRRRIHREAFPESLGSPYTRVPSVMLCICGMGGSRLVFPSTVTAAPSFRLSMPCPAQREFSCR